MNYRWVTDENHNESTSQTLAEEIGIPTSLATVLRSRDVNTVDEARAFFEPDLDNLHDPYLMNGMSDAVDRVLLAINQGESMWIHGDYDVDGTCSTAMMLEFLRSIGGKVDYYIPDRLREGYGFSLASLQGAQANGSTLIITVDCGVTSTDVVDLAKSVGMETIIVDHHEPSNDIPQAIAILDPIKPNCNYPFKPLAACGVGFKFVQAISRRLGFEERCYEYLDYVALASAADIVPLRGENRILMKFGLEKLNTNPRPGIRGLIDCASFRDPEISSTSIVFGLAPRINAAGRLGDAKRAVDMMIQTDAVRSFQLAQELEHDNRLRRTFDETAFESAIQEADKMLEDKSTKAIVLLSSSWHAGVVGIVASRIVERYHLPAVVLSCRDGVAKGSARSISGFDVHSALRECSGLLIEYGGHKHAAGLTIKEENFAQFANEFNKIAKREVSNQMLDHTLIIDAEIGLNELSPNFVEHLHRFEPFGFANSKPIFLTRGVTAQQGARVVGNGHLKFRAYQNNFAIDAIGFGLAYLQQHCATGKSFDICYTIEEYQQKGSLGFQLRIRDLQPTSTTVIPLDAYVD